MTEPKRIVLSVDGLGYGTIAIDGVPFQNHIQGLTLTTGVGELTRMELTLTNIDVSGDAIAIVNGE